MKPKNIIICLLLIALCLLWSYSAFADETVSIEDRARFGLSQSLLNLSNFDEATELLADLYSRYPGNKKIADKFSQALAYGEKSEQVIVMLEELITMYPKDIEFKLRLAKTLASMQNYTRAIELCRDILNTDKNHKTTNLWLARFLSWNQKYDESLIVYTNLIESNPKWIIPRREKARVLGWARRYKESIAEYRLAIDMVGDDDAVHYETTAKYNFYNQFDIKANENYHRWLEIEPENLEALYDFGQVSSRQGNWSHANRMYKRVVKISPAHFRAKQALAKVEMYSTRPKLTTGFEFFEADSSGRTMDKRYWKAFTYITAPINENYYLRLRQDNIWYKFKDFSQIYQQRLAIGLDYYSRPDLWASVDYAHSIYSEEKGLGDTFGGQINYVPYDPLTLTISHQREQIVDNAATFRSKLCRDNYMVKGLYKFNRRTSTSFDYMHSRYSDDNSRNAYGFDIDHYIFLEPRSLKISYRYQAYQFEEENADYFSPDSFHYNKVSIEWRHFLNKEELFWGSNDTYYTLRYHINFDVQDEIGHGIYANFYHDWNDNCQSYFEWSRIIYENSDVYRENRIMFYTSLYF